MEWISAKDILPLPWERVVTYTPEKSDFYACVESIRIGFIDEQLQWMDDYTGNLCKYLIEFWMPLPKPPEK